MLDHLNIIKIYESFEDSENISLILELAEKDLGDLIKKQQATNKYFEEEFIWEIFYQLIKALSVVHELGITHRDVKSSNILLVKGIVKLADFNGSKKSDNGIFYTPMRTRGYFAPEIF